MMIIAVKVRQHTNYCPSISVLAILAMESSLILLEMITRSLTIEERLYGNSPANMNRSTWIIPSTEWWQEYWAIFSYIGRQRSSYWVPLFTITAHGVIPFINLICTTTCHRVCPKGQGSYSYLSRDQIIISSLALVIELLEDFIVLNIVRRASLSPLESGAW